jgi:hypothetical protein
MSRTTNGRNRRRLGLKRETLRKLSADQLGRVAGGTWGDSADCESAACVETANCDTATCWFGTGSRFC